jgi:hypothetical protein
MWIKKADTAGKEVYLSITENVRKNDLKPVGISKIKI